MSTREAKWRVTLRRPEKETRRQGNTRIDETPAVPNEPTDHAVARGRDVSLRHEGGHSQRITQWCRSGVGNHRRTVVATNLPKDQKDKSALIVSRTRCCKLHEQGA